MTNDKSKAPPKAVKPTPRSAEEVELLPDAWERFEKAVDKVAKSPPQHRVRPTTRGNRPKAIL